MAANGGLIQAKQLQSQQQSKIRTMAATVAAAFAQQPVINSGLSVLCSILEVEVSAC
jgi:hypothetical protein